MRYYVVDQHHTWHGVYVRGYGNIFAFAINGQHIYLSEAIPRKYRPVIMAHETIEGNLVDNLNLRYERVDGVSSYRGWFMKKHWEEIVKEQRQKEKCHLQAVKREIEYADELGIKEEFLKFVDKRDRSGLRSYLPYEISLVNKERRIRGLPPLSLESTA